MATYFVTGHRPHLLGGFDWGTPRNQRIIAELSERITAIIEKDPRSVWQFGGALGIDQMAFEIVRRLKASIYPELKLVLLVPFEQQASKWISHTDKARYESQKEFADSVIYVDTIPGYTFSGVPVGEYHPVKMQTRNRYGVDTSDIIFAVFTGAPGGTSKCVSYARVKGKRITGFNPDTLRSLEG